MPPHNIGRRILWIVASLLTFVPLGVNAGLLSAQSVDLQAVVACRDIESALERLDCFDRATAVLESSEALEQAAPAPDGSTGAWSVQEEVNPVDDSRLVIAALEAESGQASLGRVPTLVIRCLSNETSVFITWFEYLGSDGPMVLTRFGSQEAKTDRWHLSSNNTSSFFRGDPKEFARELMGVDRFVARVTPYGDSPITAVFDVTGTEAALATVRNACGW